MTDPTGGHRHPDDELVAAVLDGEATADERARVEGDPALMARLAEFRAVRDLVAGDVPPADDIDRERAITAAKAAVRHQPTVVPLAERRRQEVPRFLAVAAAVLLVLLAAGFLVSKVGDDRGDYAGGGDSGAESGEAEDAPSSEEPTAQELADDDEDADGAATGAPQDDAFSADVERLADLGAVADEDELVATLRAYSAIVPEGTESSDSPDSTEADTTASSRVLPQGVPGDSDTCQAGLDEADPSLSGLLVQATAAFDGTPAVVYVFATAEGGQRVVVVTVDGCEVLAAADL